MSVELGVLLSVLSALVGIAGAVATMKHRNKQEIQEDTAEKSVAIHEIQKIGEDVKEIKRDLREYRSEVRDVRDRVIVVEQSTKQAHKRLDDLVERLVH